jgi:hypothetical protein
MIEVAASVYPKHVLLSDDINRLSSSRGNEQASSNRSRLDVNLGSERFVHWTFIRNIEQLSPLFGRELANKMNVQLNAIEHYLFRFAIGAL